MAECVIIDAAPVATDEGTDEEQERALRLVEIGDEHIHNLVLIAWGNDNLSAAMKHVLLVAVKPGDDVTY